MNPAEEAEVSALVTRVFREFIASDYSDEGVAEFLSYARAESLAARQETGHFVLLAVAAGQLVGAIEMRNLDHISLLFVDPAFQGKGVATELVRRSLDLCRDRRPDLSTITVNSSPYAVPIYARLGFRPTGPQQTKHGISFVPMVLAVET